jgi:hypothetical protein
MLVPLLLLLLLLLLLYQLLMRGVYTGALSHPLIPYPLQLDHITPDMLAQFVADHYTGPHMVLSGAGISHQQLVDLAAPMLAAVPPGHGAKAAAVAAMGVKGPGALSNEQLEAAAAAGEPPSQYTGGVVRMDGSCQQAHLILGFEYAGGWRDIQVSQQGQPAYMSCCLQSLLVADGFVRQE